MKKLKIFFLCITVGALVGSFTEALFIGTLSGIALGLILLGDVRKLFHE